MIHEAEGLRRDLRRHAGARGKRFDPELRSRVMRYAGRRRGDGASWMTIATELGACFETVRRWCHDAKVPARELRRVTVVAEPAASASTSLVVVTPNGLRIEGGGIDDVVALVRALG